MFERNYTYILHFPRHASLWHDIAEIYSFAMNIVNYFLFEQFSCSVTAKLYSYYTGTVEQAGALIDVELVDHFFVEP